MRKMWEKIGAWRWILKVDGTNIFIWDKKEDHLCGLSSYLTWIYSYGVPFSFQLTIALGSLFLMRLTIIDFWS